MTLSTADLDRLVTYYTELLGATLAFERAATPADPRVAVVDVGGDDHLMIVETADAPTTDLDPLGRAGWGLRVATHRQLCEVREQILDAGWPVGQIETLPTQWTMTARDPDGRPVDVRAHRPRTAASPPPTAG
ncbi:VOC family protein [Streptomyces sp. DSM 3412]|uniref:VOC family protein n=1 Tax=Streptomyces gottesmaniae TaxID=3075518 RepID=A0ABU2Z321_9ACTN|nr:VOC family protein [Streptomyces sp. DSM 3412]